MNGGRTIRNKFLFYKTKNERDMTATKDQEETKKEKKNHQETVKYFLVIPVSGKQIGWLVIIFHTALQITTKAH